MRSYIFFMLSFFGVIGLEAAPFAYVANSGDSLVSVIDLGYDYEIETVDVVYPPDFVAIHGQYAYVVHNMVEKVTVIDTEYHTVVTTFPVSSPGKIAFTSDDHAYITNTSEDTVTVFDVSNVNNISYSDVINVSGNPYAIVIDSDDKYAYVVSAHTNEVNRIDIEYAAIDSEPVIVGSGSYNIAITPNDDQLYVTATTDDSVVVIDTTTFDTSTPTDLVELNVGRDPRGVATFGTSTYICNYASKSLSVINASAAPPIVTSSVSLSIHPYQMALAFIGTDLFAYMVDPATFTFLAYNLSDNEQDAYIQVGEFPISIAITTFP